MALYQVVYSVHDYTLADQCLPSLGRTQKMKPPSCHIHMICTKTGYPFGHHEDISGDAQTT